MDPKLLWLLGRSAATAPFRPLAWELLYAKGAALRKKKGKKKRERRRIIEVQNRKNPRCCLD